MSTEAKGEHARGRRPARSRRTKRKRDANAEQPPTQMVSMRELSRYLNVSRSTLWKLVHNGQVPYYRVGSQYRFDVVAVAARMASFT